MGSIPGLGRSPGGGHGNPLQYSCLENPHGQRSLAGCGPWGRKESDMTEETQPTCTGSKDPTCALKQKKKKEEDVERYTGTDEAETGRSHGKAEAGVTLPPAKQHQGWTTASRRFSFSAPGGTSPTHTWTSDFQPPEQTSVALVWHPLLHSPGK